MDIDLSVLRLMEREKEIVLTKVPNITVLAGGAIVGSRLATPGDPLWPVDLGEPSDRGFDRT